MMDHISGNSPSTVQPQMATGNNLPSGSNGQMPNGQIPNGQIPNNQMPNGQIPNGQIPNGQMPNGQIPNGQIPNNQMPNGQMPNGQIPNGQIPNGQMPNGQIPNGQMPNGQMPNGQIPNGQITTAERFLADILDVLPSWDMTAARAPPTPSMQPPNNEIPPSQPDFVYNNFFAAMEPTVGDFGSIGMPCPPIGRPRRYPSESSNNSNLFCSLCDLEASTRCLECNDYMCDACLEKHRKSPIFAHHIILVLPTAIGTAPSPTSGVSSATLTEVPLSPNYICDLHNEILRYVCDTCKKLVCQCCTLHEHKEHNYTSIASFSDTANETIQSSIESSTVGTKYIKSSIDKALTYIRMIERNCIELSENIRKAFRQLIIAIEDRERCLLDFVDKLRQRRLATLHDQMAGLKSALSGLSETADMLQKLCENYGRMDQIEIAMKVVNGQRQLEQFAAIYKDLKPKHEIFGFITPDYTMLQNIRNQGGIIQVDEQNIPIMNRGGVLGAVNAEMGAVMLAGSSSMPVANVSMPPNIRRPFMRENSFHSIPSPLLPICGGSACGIPTTGLEWELNVLRTSPNLHFGALRGTQAIPGCIEHVKVSKSQALSLSFATEGHADGQVSRPWGLCVDKNGNILISDRRNNRVQIFKPDGTLKCKFGRKGVGNGEFDLPAGICVDIDNRIIVVDKDNHRVQIFNATGMYLSKFGIYGKEYGQFQYPWDVAVNSRRQIVVTDSRNHRIQQFDSDGRFIRQIVFDNHGQNKGVASPRGVCYTPTGNIIVSDFDNHCLYLIKPDINEIISAKGHEGTGIQEFNRPSGICCDDDGCIIVADSKNQRIIVFSPNLDYLWSIEIRPSINPLMPLTLDEKDRTCDVALMPDGRIVFLIELSPDSKEGTNPYKRFVHVF